MPYSDYTAEELGASPQAVAEALVAENLVWLSQVDRSALDASPLFPVHILSMMAAMNSLNVAIGITPAEDRTFEGAHIRLDNPVIKALYSILKEALRDAGLTPSRSNYCRAVAEVRHWWKLTTGSDYNGINHENMDGEVRAAHVDMLKHLEARLVSRALFGASDSWAAGLDRSSLGVFAVPESILAIVDATKRADEYSSHYKVLGEIHNEFYRRQEAEGVDYDNVYESACLDAELMFWQEKSRGYAFRSREGLEDNLSQLLMRLDVISEHPEMHSYFEAGIWDLEFIRKCMAGGVDADLANAVL